MIQINKIGSALSMLGTTLMGVGLLYPDAPKWVAISGFAIKALGSACEILIAPKQEDSK